MQNQKGLVLEGGAMRGLFTAGIIDVFMLNQISFDGMIGVSAGATFGCNFKSKQIGRPLRYCKRFAKDWRFCSLKSFFKTGDFFGAEFCYHKIPDTLDAMDYITYTANPMPMTVVCTDIHSGTAIYHKSESISTKEMEWFRASASMPLASRIVSVDGFDLLDGGVTDSIPLQYFQKQGYHKNVVVLTQPLGYQKKKNSLMPMMRTKYKNYPALVSAIECRHIMYNQEIAYVAEQENTGNTFVIRPPEKLPIGHMCHDPQLMQEIYEIGVNTAQKILPDLIQFLEA